MKNKIVYLDNNATTKVDERVLKAMLPYFCEQYANPSSMHSFGGDVAKVVKHAREQVCDFLGAEDSSEIFFTASGSESANMAIRGALKLNPSKKHIVTTKIEHPCVLNLFKNLEKSGYKTTYLSINSDGEIDEEELRNSITSETVLVAMMKANNETGIIFPVEKFSEIVKSINPETLFFVDAVQAAGKIPIDVKNSKIDLLSVSGHKFHAPKGIGVLYVRKNVKIAPLIIGGHQERGYRAGTENVPYIVGIGVAAELAKSYLDDENTRVRALRDKLEKGLLKSVYNARLNGTFKNRVPNTSNIGFEYIEGELMLLHMSDVGICASSGSACTSGSLEPSHVLKAMGVPFTCLHGSIRFSLSRFTTEEEIDYTLKVMPEIIDKLRKISPFQKELAELKKQKA